MRFYEMGLLSCLGQRRLRLRDDGAKRASFVHGEIGQNLAVQLNTSQLQAVHELTIGQAFDANSSVNALDPKRAEGALLRLAVAIGILARLFDSLTGDANRILPTAVKAFGGI